MLIKLSSAVDTGLNDVYTTQSPVSTTEDKISNV